jgi:putative SOS response-associated peptidase YedK
MCGRFVRYTSWSDLRRALSVLTGAEPPPRELPPSYNVAPTQSVLAVREQGGKRQAVIMRWGLIPSWAKDKKMAQINARGDGVATKPMFRAAFKRRRCLIVADGYYEWKKLDGKTKQPYLYHLKNGEPFTIAGIWEIWKGEGEDEAIESCAIITTDANDLARAVHDRMPVILHGDDAAAWIDPAVEDAGSLVPLLRPLSADKMEAFAVSTRVNKAGVNDKALIEPTHE